MREIIEKLVAELHVVKLRNDCRILVLTEFLVELGIDRSRIEDRLREAWTEAQVLMEGRLGAGPSAQLFDE